MGGGLKLHFMHYNMLNTLYIGTQGRIENCLLVMGQTLYLDPGVDLGVGGGLKLHFMHYNMLNTVYARAQGRIKDGHCVKAACPGGCWFFFSSKS